MSSELVFRKVHDGASSGYSKVEMPCNAYCKPPLHCDLFYTQIAEPLQNMVSIQGLLDFFLTPKVKITRIEEAREAPANPPSWHIAIGIATDSPLYAWLVFWKAYE